MPNWTPADIRRQLDRATKSGWDAFFRKSGTDYDFPASLLMAVASRETNMQNIIGDHGHGFGIMQIDVGSFGDWCHSGQWRQVDAAIQKGAQVLDMKREAVRLGQGKRLSVGGKAYTGKAIADEAELIRIALAAYNSGGWAYYNFSTNGDPDRTTTGHDYSADTLAREQVFRQLLS